MLGDANQRIEKLESGHENTENHTAIVEDRMDHLEGDYNK